MYACRTSPSVYKQKGYYNMKIRGDYILDTIGGEKMAVPLSADNHDQTGLVKLNDAGAFLWERLQSKTTEEELVQALTEEYEVTQEKAAADVRKFLDKLSAKGLLEE